MSSMSEPYTLVEIEEIKSLPKGTHIAHKILNEQSKPEESTYRYGVYLGNYKVGYFSGANMLDADREKYDILQVLKSSADGKLYRVEYNDHVKTLPVEETLKKAEEVLIEPSTWPGFQTVNNNCESFARWLKTGEQVPAKATDATTRIIPLVVRAIHRSVNCSGASLQS